MARMFSSYPAFSPSVITPWSKLGGEEMLLIDKLRYIHRVQGKDILALTREHLGLDG